MQQPVNLLSRTRIAAVLVNWRRPRLTIEAASRIAAQTVPVHVIIVDNGSDDGSAAQFEKSVPDASVITLDRNGGFGAGCNAGIRRALEQGYTHVWLINNDAEPSPDALWALLARLSAAADVGIVGSRLVDPSGAMPCHAGAILDPRSLGSRATMSEAELNGAHYAWVSAASALIPSSVLRHVGYFDEAFFMYWEDADLSMRIRAAGHQIAVAPDSVVVHEAGSSSVDQSVDRYRWHLSSQALFIDKHLPHAFARKTLLIARYLLKALRDGDLRRMGMVMAQATTILTGAAHLRRARPGT